MGLTLNFDERNITLIGGDGWYLNSLVLNRIGLIRWVFLVSRKVMKNDDGMRRMKLRLDLSDCYNPQQLTAWKCLKRCKPIFKIVPCRWYGGGDDDDMKVE